MRESLHHFGWEEALDVSGLTPSLRAGPALLSDQASRSEDVSQSRASLSGVNVTEGGDCSPGKQF